MLYVAVLYLIALILEGVCYLDFLNLHLYKWGGQNNRNTCQYNTINSTTNYSLQNDDKVL